MPLAAAVCLAAAGSAASQAALAVKVRLHEAVNSRDVLDFNVLMSPHDVWSAYLAPNATGGATLKTDDNSCTSQIIAAAGLSTAKLAYTGANADSGPTTAERSKEGYVELIVMGECSGKSTDTSGCFAAHADGATGGPGIGYLTQHVEGTPCDCTTADSYFEAQAPAWDGSSIPTNGNPIAAGTAATPADPPGYGPVTDGTRVAGIPATVAPFEHRFADGPRTSRSPMACSTGKKGRCPPPAPHLARPRPQWFRPCRTRPT